MGVEVKGEQGLRKLPEEGLEDDRGQVQIIVLVEVHWQPWGRGWRQAGPSLEADSPSRVLEAKQTPLPAATA